MGRLRGTVEDLNRDKRMKDARTGTFDERSKDEWRRVNRERDGRAEARRRESERVEREKRKKRENKKEEEEAEKENANISKSTLGRV